MKYLVTEDTKEILAYELEDSAKVKCNNDNDTLRFHGKNIEENTTGDFVINTIYLNSWCVVDKPPRSFIKPWKKLF